MTMTISEPVQVRTASHPTDLEKQLAMAYADRLCRELPTASATEGRELLESVIGHALARHRYESLKLPREAIENLERASVSDESLEAMDRGWTPRQVTTLIARTRELNTLISSAGAVARCVQKGFAE